MFGQHIALGAHQGDVSLAIGQALGQALPAVHRTQLHRPTQPAGQVLLQSAVGGIVFSRSGWNMPTPKVRGVPWAWAGDSNKGRPNKAAVAPARLRRVMFMTYLLALELKVNPRLKIAE